MYLTQHANPEDGMSRLSKLSYVIADLSPHEAVNCGDVIMATQSESGEATTMTVEVSIEINRPVADVFEFFAENHVENHPRWDPNMELEKETDGPIGVGTVIRRRNMNYDESREGTMEVVEFEPNEAMGTVIKEAGMEIPGRATFEEIGPESTRLTLSAEFPDSLDREVIQQNMTRSTRNIKELIESER